jgi:hypothetical protein
VEQRLAEMERRLARAERRSRVASLTAAAGIAAALILGMVRPAVTDSPGSTVKAPFRVVDDQGRSIVEVTSNGASTRLRLMHGISADRQTGLRIDACETLADMVLMARDKGSIHLMAAEDESSAFLLDKKGVASLTAGKAGKLRFRSFSDQTP